MASLNLSITQTSDDGWWVPDSGAFLTNVTQIGAGRNSDAENHMYFRFNDVTIPAGYKIQSATLTLTAAISIAAHTANLVVVAVAQLNPNAPTDAEDAEGRPLTTASVEWNSVEGWTVGQTYSPPDVASVIQELVDQDAWESGNAVVVCVRDNGSTGSGIRFVADYSHSTHAPASLNIEYEPAMRPATLENSQTFHAPAITPGPVTIEPSLIESTAAVFTPGVEPGLVEVSPGMLTNSSTLYESAVTAGTVTVAPAVLINLQDFYTPRVRQILIRIPVLSSQPTVVPRFTLPRGVDAWINFVVHAMDGETPEDIRLWDMGCYFGREGQSSRSNELTKTTDNSGIVLVNPESGQGRVVLSRTETLAMASGVWAFDLWCLNEGDNRPVSLGTIDLIQTSRSRGDR